jgi:hypothetical protein
LNIYLVASTSEPDTTLICYKVVTNCVPSLEICVKEGLKGERERKMIFLNIQATQPFPGHIGLVNRLTGTIDPQYG